MVEYDGLMRLLPVVVILMVMMCWEHSRPRRLYDEPIRRRWIVNLSIALINTALLRIIMPIFPIGVAVWAAESSIGLLYWLPLSGILHGCVAFVALDLTIYWQHRLMHRVPLLWRLHRMHHSDTAIDVTTGIRFHPLEMCVSLIIKCIAVAAIGAPVTAVFAFELVLAMTSIFNHSNVYIPEMWDAWLRYIIVTPDMHRVHHSIKGREMNHNYGFNLPWWDRIFASYQAQPLDGHQKMRIGLTHFREARAQRLDQLLIQPFLKDR